MSTHSDTTQPVCGALYIATGVYLLEAYKSVESLKKCMPNLHVTLISDQKPSGNLFDDWIMIEHPHNTGRDKVQQMKYTPYEHTLFLDSDTYVAAPLDDVFAMLKDYDFLAAIEDGRGYWYGEEIGVPKTFPEINGGVMAFRKTPAIMRIWESWEAEYQRTISWQKNYNGRTWDQPSLRKLLWEARREIRISILPTEYNVLATWGSFIYGDPIIVHTRNKPERMLNRIRKHRLEDRVCLGQIGCLRSPYNMTLGEWFVSLFRIHAVFLTALVARIFSSKNQ